MTEEPKNLRAFASSCETSQSELVPKLRFPEFRGAEGWKMKSLGAVARLRNGYAFKSSEYVDAGPFQIITIANVQQGSLALDATKKVANLPRDIQEHQILQISDILISMTGNVGRVCRVTSEGLLLNQRVGKLAPHQIDQEYFYHLLQRDEFRNAMQLKAAGGAQGNLSSGDIVEYELSCPPSPAEQKKIADCLSSLDELIAAQARKVNALKTHKKGLMQGLFPQGIRSEKGEVKSEKGKQNSSFSLPTSNFSPLIPRLRFPEFRNAGEWTPKTIGQLGEVITGSTPSTVKPEYYGGDRLFVSPADISDNRFIDKTKTSLTEEGFLETRPVKANSILFVCIGSTIGKIAQNRYECATNQQINSVVPNSENSDGFVYYALGGITDKIANIAGKQAVPIVNKSLFSSVELTAPKLPEQKRIANFLSSIDETILAEIQKLEALKTHKKGLMQQLFPSPQELNS